MTSDTGPTTQQLRRHIYLDVCALNRPLDDQNQMRIRLEADYVEYHRQWQDTLDPVQFFDLVFGVQPSGAE